MIIRDYNINYRTGEKVKFAFFGDWHWESENCRRDDIRNEVTRLRRDEAYVFGMGDYSECMLPNDKRYKHQNFHKQYRNLSPDMGITLTVKQVGHQFRRLGDRLLGVLSGNHEDSMLIHNKRNFMWELCNELVPMKEEDMDTRHPLDLGYNAPVRIKFVRVDDAGKRQHSSVMIFKLWHGDGWCLTKESWMTKLKKHANHFESDLHVMGHCHQLAFEEDTSRLYLPTTGELKIKHHQRYYGLSGSFYLGHLEGVDGYVDKKDCKPTEIGCLKVKVDPETKSIERYK